MADSWEDLLFGTTPTTVPAAGQASEGRNALVIDPEVCIDCALCVPECPVDAIAHEHQLPERQRAWIRLNRDLARQWPPITRARAALPGAAGWAAVADKVGQLDRRPGSRHRDESE